MRITDVKQQIKSKHLDNLYIFTGPEWIVRSRYEHKIAEIADLRMLSADTVGDIFHKLGGSSIFNQPICYVVRDDSEFMKAEDSWKSVEQLLKNNSNIVILEFSNIDKRSKFYKHFKDRIVEFEYLPDELLLKYIQREIDLKERSCEKLIKICENDFGRILLEIDKIKQYVDTNQSEDGAFEQLVKDGTIHQPARDALFEWVDAVLKRHVNESFELYEHCKHKEIATLVMLSVLYTNVKQVLQVQDCMRESANIAKSTGMSAYQIKLAKEKTGYYGIGELVYMLQCIREAEVGIKIGKVEEKTAIPELLVKVL